MENKFFKIFSIVIPAFVIFAWPGKAVSQYRVSGVVEFAYRSLETKIGNSTTSSEQYWTQTYRSNLQGDLFDPRFMRFSGGIGYSVYTYKNAPDSNTLDYNFNTTFFPGMKVSWDLFGSKSVNTIENSTNIAGYDVTTSTYGGTLNLRLGSNDRGGNGGNNNSSAMRWPGLTLSRFHTESESQGTTSPIQETRDDTAASITYRVNSAIDVNLDGRSEDYENVITGARYETKTANLYTNVRLSPDADLRLAGHVTDRVTQNIAGYATETSQSYNAIMDFKEKDGIRQYYKYDFNRQQTTVSDFTTQRAEARVVYKLREYLRVQGGADYGLSDYFLKPTTTDPVGEKTTLESGGPLAGVMFKKNYAPYFLGPLSFDSAYDLTSGFSKLTSGTGGTEGSGFYYTNNVSLGFSTTGRGKENISLGYNFNNRRDSSPVHNNMWQHNYRFFISTQRVPKTVIRGSANYISLEYRNDAANISRMAPIVVSQQTANVNQKRRSLIYDLAAEHTVSSYLSLTAGASRGQSTSTSYTLSTLTSLTSSEDSLSYGAVNFTYPITRLLIYRVQLREEYRSTQTTDTQSHQVNMFLDYRIRQIFVTAEYRWWQDVPDSGSRNEQQYYYVKLSRPF